MEEKKTEAKLDPSGSFEVSIVKKRGRVYGEIRSYKRAKFAGRRLVIYWAYREPGETYRLDHSWAIDKTTISFAINHGAKFIGILVKDGTRYVTPVENFRPGSPGLHIRDFTGKGKGGSLQHYLRMPFWHKLDVPEEVKTERALEDMHIGRKKRKTPKSVLIM